MRMRSPILIIVAAIFGLLAAAIVFVRVGNSGAEKAIVVATGEIEAGSAIRAEQVKTVPWATSVVPQGAFEDAKQVVGRIARSPLATGEPVLEFNLAKPDAMSGLASVINEGRRAISVEADEVSGVAGFITPGSYVDVLVSGKDMSGASFSKIVLQYVRVLAVEQDTKANPEQPRVVRAVTLELTPEQSERLDLARAIGKLSLALRNEFDKRPTQSRGARLDDLMAGAGTAPPSPGAAATAPGMAPSVRPAAARGTPSPDYASRPAVEEVRGTGNMDVAN